MEIVSPPQKNFLGHHMGGRLTGAGTELLGPNLGRLWELVSLLGPKFGPNSAACVTFWAKIRAYLGSLCHLLCPKLDPFLSLCHFLGPNLAIF